MKTEEDEAFDDLAKRQGAWGGGFPAKRAMAADKLLEPEQEPVAWQWLGSAHFRKKLPKNADITAWNPLYTAPPQRPWVGLTDDETMLIANQTSGQNWGNESHIQRLRKTIENKLKEKNS